MWHERNVGKGMIAGFVGGLIGTIVMTKFQNGWTKASSALKDGNKNQSQHNSRRQGEQETEDATMKAAGRIAELGGRHISHAQKKKLGPIVHYSFGTLQGAVYGAVAEMAGDSRGLLSGLLFGTALFVAADEIAVPALGFSGKPAEYPLSSHLYGLACHLVYGLSAEVARRGLRTMM